MKIPIAKSSHAVPNTLSLNTDAPNTAKASITEEVATKISP